VVTGNVYSNDHDTDAIYTIDHSLFGGSIDFNGGSFGSFSHNIVVGGGISLSSEDFEPYGATITDNIVVGSPESGIGIGSPTAPRVRASVPVTLTGNLAIANAGHGIDAESGGNNPQIIDGGHNRAFLNRTNPQCIGVAC
jgi:hypothetical protein